MPSVEGEHQQGLVQVCVLPGGYTGFSSEPVPLGPKHNLLGRRTSLRLPIILSATLVILHFLRLLRVLSQVQTHTLAHSLRQRDKGGKPHKFYPFIPKLHIVPLLCTRHCPEINSNQDGHSPCSHGVSSLEGGDGHGTSKQMR